jgi:hypothetical protein
VSYIVTLVEPSASVKRSGNFLTSFVTAYYHHHHHHNNMALQPKPGSGSLFWGFVRLTFLQGWIVSPAPNPQPGGPGLRIYGLRRQGGPAVPPDTGDQF